jgi:glycosyltransferase involved in cell wall biosynthesis
MHDQISPLVTVVIASHRNEHIRKCVDQCMEKMTGPTFAEIIVVADYPVDDFTVSYTAVQWIYCPDKSIPRKRNVGIANGRGAIVGFIDDDCMPLDHWVERAVGYLNDHPDHAGVAGKTIVERREGISYPLNEFKRLETPSFRTNNIFYRRDILLKNGGFDERFVVQREDIDLAFSILETGRLIGYDPDMKVMHCCREKERWDLMKNCVNRRFDPLLYKKHRKLYRKWIVTPFTPSIGLVFFVHGLFALGLWYGGKYLGIALGMEALSSLVLGARRNGRRRIDVRQLLCDGASYCAAPFVLIGALIHGSIKFKRLLLF